MNEAADRLPVSVLTGFLGSGKTTLLRELLTHPGMDKTAVIINEFGEIGLDHLLVRSASEDMTVLNSGCLCCTVRSDLVETMRELFLKRARGEVPAFDRVVIETTGLADPAPVIHTLINDPLISARFRLDGIVTTVDAVNGARQLDEHPESLKQAAVADRLLVTKQDLAQSEAIAALEGRLRRLNPASPIHAVAHGRIEPECLFNAGLFDPKKKIPDVEKWLRAEAYEQHDAEHRHGHDHGDGHRHDHGAKSLDVNRHDDRIRAFCLNHDRPIAWETLALWMDLLMLRHGGDLLRVKAIVNVEGIDKPVVIHGVQHMFHPPVMLEEWPSADRRSRIVLIARDLSPDSVESLFRAVTEAPDPVAAARSLAEAPETKRAG